MHAFDRRTEFSSLDRVCIACSAVNTEIWRVVCQEYANFVVVYMVIINKHKVKKILYQIFRKDWNKFPEIIAGNFRTHNPSRLRTIAVGVT